MVWLVISRNQSKAGRMFRLQISRNYSLLLTHKDVRKEGSWCKLWWGYPQSSFIKRWLFRWNWNASTDSSKWSLICSTLTVPHEGMCLWRAKQASDEICHKTTTPEFTSFVPLRSFMLQCCLPGYGKLEPFAVPAFAWMQKIPTYHWEGRIRCATDSVAHRWFPNIVILKKDELICFWKVHILVFAYMDLLFKFLTDEKLSLMHDWITSLSLKLLSSSIFLHCE